MTHNAILHAKSKQYYWEGNGSLSIKTFRNGRAYYNTGRGHFMVEEGRYLLLNRGQDYSIMIDSETPVESFCVFFPDGMVEEIYHSLIKTNSELLDSPNDNQRLSLDFVEKTYINNKIITPILCRLRREYLDKNTEIGIEEKLHELLSNLLVAHRQVYAEMLKLPSQRSSTREELYKRLHIGHDYLTAYFNKKVTLNEVAQAACLSPNHFLRNYKLLFGMTPHQFLTERRLQEAQHHLVYTDQSVTDICLNIGFESLGTFSSLFQKRFGVSPSQFRKKVRFKK